MIIHVELQGDTQLAQIIFARGGLSGSLGLGKSSHEQRGQNGDDGDNHQKLDQREASLKRPGCVLLWLAHKVVAHVSGCGWLSLFQRLRAESVASIHLLRLPYSTWPSQNTAFAPPL